MAKKTSPFLIDNTTTATTEAVESTNTGVAPGVSPVIQSVEKDVSIPPTISTPPTPIVKSESSPFLDTQSEVEVDVEQGIEQGRKDVNKVGKGDMGGKGDRGKGDMGGKGDRGKGDMGGKIDIKSANKKSLNPKNVLDGDNIVLPVGLFNDSLSKNPEKYNDTDVVNLLRALKMQESTNNYKALGGASEYGAYQITPGTWFDWTGKPLQYNEPPEIQDEVAYNQVKKLKDLGYKGFEIASIWNAGIPDPYQRNPGGLDIEGKSYNAVTHNKNVQAYYNEIIKQERVKGNASSFETRAQAEEEDAGDLFDYLKVSGGSGGDEYSGFKEGFDVGDIPDFFVSVLEGIVEPIVEIGASVGNNLRPLVGKEPIKEGEKLKVFGKEIAGAQYRDLFSKETAGNVALTALNFTGLGLLSKALKPLAKVGGISEESFKKVGGNLAEVFNPLNIKTGLATGAAYGVSESLAEDKSLAEGVKDTAISTAGGGIFGGLNRFLVNPLLSRLRDPEGVLSKVKDNFYKMVEDENKVKMNKLVNDNKFRTDVVDTVLVNPKYSPEIKIRDKGVATLDTTESRNNISQDINKLEQSLDELGAKLDEGLGGATPIKISDIDKKFEEVATLTEKDLAPSKNEKKTIKTILDDFNSKLYENQILTPDGRKTGTFERRTLRKIKGYLDEDIDYGAGISKKLPLNVKYKLRKVINEVIADSYPDVADDVGAKLYKEINNEYSKRIEADLFLTGLNGQTIKGGKLLNKLAEGNNNILYTILGGHTGGVPGALAGLGLSKIMEKIREVGLKNILSNPSDRYVLMKAIEKNPKLADRIKRYIQDLEDKVQDKAETEGSQVGSLFGNVGKKGDEAGEEVKEEVVEDVGEEIGEEVGKKANEVREEVREEIKTVDKPVDKVDKEEVKNE